MTAARRKIEREIAADPENPQPYGVLGDILVAGGDPHGELITMQATLHERPTDKALRKREQKLIGQHAAHLLGELAPDLTRKARDRRGLEIEWFMGFMRSVRIEGGEGDHDLVKLLPLLFALPAARFLRELRLGAPATEQWEFDATIATLAKCDVPATVRSLVIGDDYGDGGHWRRLYPLGRLAPLYKRFPRLEKLRLEGAEVDLGRLALPALRELVIDLGGSCSDRALLRQVIKGGARKLERLAIDFGPNGSADIKPADVRELVDGFPKLVSLALEMIRPGPELVAALVAGKAARRLEYLKLRWAGLRDDSVDLLLANTARLPKLAAIDVDCNQLSPAACKRLRGLCKDVEIGDQEAPD